MSKNIVTFLTAASPPNFRKQQQPPVIKPQTRIHSRIILPPSMPPIASAHTRCWQAPRSLRAHSLTLSRACPSRLLPAALPWNALPPVANARSGPRGG